MHSVEKALYSAKCEWYNLIELWDDLISIHTFCVFLSSARHIHILNLKIRRKAASSYHYVLHLWPNNISSTECIITARISSTVPCYCISIDADIILVSIVINNCFRIGREAALTNMGSSKQPPQFIWWTYSFGPWTYQLTHCNILQHSSPDGCHLGFY